jgi:hypothetical protein
MNRLILILFFILFSFPLFAQMDPVKRDKLSKKHLTYFYMGRACPPVTNTESKYGFQIKCKGCVVTLGRQWHNKRVVRKIDRIYGKGWFEENRSSFW